MLAKGRPKVWQNVDKNVGPTPTQCWLIVGPTLTQCQAVVSKVVPTDKSTLSRCCRANVGPTIVHTIGLLLPKPKHEVTCV